MAGVRAFPPQGPTAGYMLPVASIGRLAVRLVLDAAAGGEPTWRVDRGGVTDSAAEWFTSTEFRFVVYELADDRKAIGEPRRHSYADIRQMVIDAETELARRSAR